MKITLIIQYFIFYFNVLEVRVDFTQNGLFVLNMYK